MNPQKRTKAGNSSIIGLGVGVHFALGMAIFLVVFLLQFISIGIHFFFIQVLIWIIASSVWSASNLTRVPINHIALRLWFGARFDPNEPWDEEMDVAGEGMVINWPWGMVSWLPMPTSRQVIPIGTDEKPFSVQSGSFKLKQTKTPKSGPKKNVGAIYLHVSMTVTFIIENYRVLDFETLDKAEQAFVAILTSLTRDVILIKEKQKSVKDPAEVCEKKNEVEVEVDSRAKGTYLKPDGTYDTTHSAQIGDIGIKVIKINIRKIDPDPEVVKAIEKQRTEELDARSRGTETDGVTERMEKYKTAGLEPIEAAILDIAAEWLNAKKTKPKG